MLEVRNLEAGYGKLQVLFGVDISVEKGSVTGVLGPNGSGKSTLLKTIFGILKPWSGYIKIEGHDVTGFPPKRMIRMGIAFVPQGRALFPSMTVRENLEVASYALGEELREDHFKIIRELFPNLAEKLDDDAASLSGGEQRMLEVARGILFMPKILMLDEPSAGLAPKITDMIYEKLLILNKEYDVTLLIVEQNVYKALEVCENVYLLELGRNKYHGRADDLQTRKAVLESYLT